MRLDFDIAGNAFVVDAIAGIGDLQREQLHFAML